MSKKKTGIARKSTWKPDPSKLKRNADGVVLLSGGNPQIPKGDGDGPVRAYIAAMPGWKGEIGRTLDALIERTIPNVIKAVRWNTPFYGTPEKGYFLGYHCMTKYIKVTFFRGTSLHPVPPEESKHPETRYVHLHEGEPVDEKQLGDWIRQAAAIPGWMDFNCKIEPLA